MKQTAHRVVKGLHTVFDFVIISAIILLVFFAIFTAWETGRIYRKSDAELLASYKPSAEDDLSFAELQKINSDVIGWLSVYGTPIDYPVVQSEDNNKYINSDVFGSFSLTGALFLDYKNNPGFTDFNNIIFGHHMEKDMMFGNLDEFKDARYLKEHSTGNLYAGGKDFGIKLFAWMDVDAYDPDLYNTEIESMEGRQELIERIRDIAIVYTDGIADPDKRILLMSTCGTDTTNERYILAAVITEETYEDTFPEEERVERTLRGSGFPVRYRCVIYLLILLLMALIAYFIYRRMKRRRDEDA